MPRYNHAFSVAFSLESKDKAGEDVTAQMLRTALLRRIDDLDIGDEWVEATGAPFDTYEVDESVRPPDFFQVIFWDAALRTATWYFDSISEVSTALEIAYAQGIKRSEVKRVSCYPKDHIFNGSDEFLDWIKDQ